MSYLPPAEGIELYTAEQTRQLDRCAIEQQPVAGFELMLRAGQAAYQALRQRWPDVRSLTLLCGGGNNGGDALVVAGLALGPQQLSDQQSLNVQVLLVGGESMRSKLKAEALQALHWAEARGVNVESYEGQLFDGDLIVDGLLGTGLQGLVKPAVMELIGRINASGKPVLALDIPSGLCADTGAVLCPSPALAVQADLTVSFIGLNRGLLTHRGVEHCGELQLATLGVVESVYASVRPGLSVIAAQNRALLLSPRGRACHKGDFGHVLVIGGDHGMAGAVLMASEAAVRSGAGKVSVATRAEHVALNTGHCPEVMSHAVRSGQDLELLLDRASVFLIGPGLGQSAWSGQLLHLLQTRDSGKPMVVDADALNLLSQGRLVDPVKRDNWVLTPHPGEAARLLGCSTAQIQADRFQAVNQLQQRYGGVVVLKGAGTLICDGTQTQLCCRGNPGMASGGMGDVLSGVIAALLAQKKIRGEDNSMFDVVTLAVDLHAQAADRLAQREGERGLAATDLIPEIRRLLNLDLVLSSVMQGMPR